MRGSKKTAAGKRAAGKPLTVTIDPETLPVLKQAEALSGCPAEWLARYFVAVEAHVMTGSAMRIMDARKAFASVGGKLLPGAPRLKRVMEANDRMRRADSAAYRRTGKLRPFGPRKDTLLDWLPNGKKGGAR